MSEQDLEAILSPARAFNEARAVTGLLLYAQQSFLQVLEGDEDAVTAVYEQIVGSSRHTNLRRTVSASDSERRFPAWSMGFATAAPRAVVEQLLSPLVAENLISHDQAVGVLLSRFAELNVPRQASREQPLRTGVGASRLPDRRADAAVHRQPAGPRVRLHACGLVRQAATPG